MNDMKGRNGRRGATGLIRACLVARELCAERVTAAERLERELGELEARRLVGNLTGPRRHARRHARTHARAPRREETAAAA